MAAVSLRGVSKRFGKVWAVHDVDLDVEDGEFVVFVGPSGCGKSTLLRLVAGLEDPTAGEILIDGELVNDRTPAERGIAMVFQSYALYPHMTVYDNMAFGLRQARYGRQGIADRIRRAAAILRIEELLQRKPRELSGGQRQRVAIGRAIVREPKVFLFDEPLSNLDAALRVDMRLELAKLHADLDATMIYVTHDQVEAMTLAQKIVVLNAGRVEQIGAPLALYHRPRNLFVAGFIGSPRMNFIPGRIVHAAPGSATVAFAGGAELAIPVAAEAAVSVGAPATLGIRPEHLLARGGGDAALAGSLAAVERLGSETHLHLSLDDGSRLTMRVDADSAAAIGDRVAAGIPAAACHLFDRDGAALT